MSTGGHLVHVWASGTVRRVTWPENQSVPCVAWKFPVSRFMVLLVFRIHSASLIHLVCRSSSLSITLTPSQSITWFSFTAWSVIAELCVWPGLWWLLSVGLTVPEAQMWTRCPPVDIETSYVNFFISCVISNVVIFLDPTGWNYSRTDWCQLSSKHDVRINNWNDILH